MIKRQIAHTGTCGKGGQFDAWMEDTKKKEEVEHMTFEEELKNEKNPSSIKIGSYLLERSKTDPSIASAIQKENKSLKECLRFLAGEAFKLMIREGNVGYAPTTDEWDYSMAVHYYDEDDIKIAPLKGVEKVAVKAVDQKKIVTKQKENQAPSVQTQQPKETVKTTRKKKSDPVEGQISLFEV